MKRALVLLLAVSLLVGLVGRNVLAQGPSRAELEEVVFNVEAHVGIDETETADLRSWLEDEVEQHMALGRLAPLYLKVGQYPREMRVFTDPEETFLALSLAYPFLSPELQTDVKAFLDQEYQDYPPHEVAHYPMDGPDFTRREPYPLPQDKKDTSGRYLREGHHIGSLYALWAYAYYTSSWDQIESDWGEIQTVFDDFVGTWDCPTNDEDTNQNRYLSGLIGYVRMAYELGQTTEVDRGLDELERLIPARLANARWRGGEAQQYTDQYGNLGNSGGPEFDGQQWRGMYKEAGVRTLTIPQFLDFTPELGRLLSTYADEATASCVHHTQRVLSNWYIVGDENPVHTYEKRIELPDNVLALFQMMAYVAQPGGDTLKLYASAPLVVGDLHYYQKTVAAIQAYGNACYEDLRTTEQECSDGSTSGNLDAPDEADGPNQLTAAFKRSAFAITAAVCTPLGYVAWSDR